MITTLILRRATANDRARLITLLQQTDLLTDDLPADLTHFLLAFDGDRLIGSGGIESYGDAGLVRSVAVDSTYRSRQIGRQIVETIRQQSQLRGLSTLYLLTTTAKAYFERLGFTPTKRDSVPASIAQTGQFSGLYPSSAVVMVQHLGSIHETNLSSLYR